MKISIIIMLLLIGIIKTSGEVMELGLFHEVVLEDAKGASYFKSRVYQSEEMYLIVKAFKPHYYNDFYIYIAHYSYNPTDEEIYSTQSWENVKGNEYYSGETYEYYAYKYYFNTYSTDQYLAFYFETNQDCKVALYVKSLNHVYYVDLLQEIELRDCLDPYYFKIPAFSNDDMAIKTKVYYPYYTMPENFQVYIKGFSENPSDDQIRYDSSGWYRLIEYDFDRGTTYDSYSYPFETIENVQYLGFYFKCDSYDFVIFWVYSKTATKLVLILLCIFIPLIVIGAIVGVVLKKCGCKKD